jgi:Tfp pilus assembly protein PilX
VTARFRIEERGVAIVVAMVTMTVMLALGLAAIAFGGGQRQLAAGERFREATFNIAEATLNTQIFLLSRTWPGSAATAFPATCTSTTTATNCPDLTTVNSQFTDKEYTGYSWKTAVQDNGGANPGYYSTAVAAAQPSYDANGDGTLWVRGEATIRGVTRAIVTQVKANIQSIPFPRNTLTAGYFATTNNGKKVVLDTNGSSYSSTPTQPGTIAVRCSSGPKSSCLDYDASKGQVSPPTYQTSYPAPPLVTSDQLNAMRGIAKANNTYYSSGCPSTLTGSLVFIENGTCSYNSGTFNSLTSFGMVVIATGTLSLGGNATYHGLVYAANLQGSTGYVVSLGGCSKIIGSVAVDGQGGVLAGSCGTNIAFNPNATFLAKGYSDPAAVKATWREVGT